MIKPHYIGKKHYFSDSVAFEEKVADVIVEVGNQAINRHGQFMLALSGGNTPKSIYKLLANRRSTDLDWSKTHIFLTDERFVPHTHADSNYGMIKTLLLDYLDAPNLYPMWRDNCSSSDAALMCINDLMKAFNLNLGEVPQFDLIILGMGQDGHVASLFPDEYSTISKNEIVTSSYVKKLDSHRMTLTFDVLNNAAKLVFIIRGKKKEHIIELLEKNKGEAYPVSHLDFLLTKSEWIINHS
jgi:6-phosphogluconolactonase